MSLLDSRFIFVLAKEVFFIFYLSGIKLFLLTVVSGYFSPSLVCLPFLDLKKRLITIAGLSVVISQVTPRSGRASVHVVKAIYEQ